MAGSADLDELLSRIRTAIAARATLIGALHADDTDCYRLFHGVAEGAPGLTIDRYGELVLLQSFRDPLDARVAAAIEGCLAATLPHEFTFASRDRASDAHQPAPDSGREFECREQGDRFAIRPCHRGQDPWLFLDLRAGRRWLRASARDRSVLNLFAYTCTASIAAARAGASEVWSVDFASSALAVGRANAARNGVGGRIRFVQEDCLPVLRQLAGQPVQRRGRPIRHARLEPRDFDIVLLDPPAFARTRFGTIDVERDYESLFKPALLATAPGGAVIATNHVATVGADEWFARLERCAAKAGRPLVELTRLQVDDDFPSFDRRPPLKIAIARPA